MDKRSQGQVSKEDKDDGLSPMVSKGPSLKNYSTFVLMQLAFVPSRDLVLGA